MEMAISASYEIFGKDAFRKYDGAAYEGRFNRAVFDIIVFYLVDEDIRSRALSRKAATKKAYETLSDNRLFIRSIETTTKSVEATRIRFTTWGQALSKALGKKISVPLIGKA